MKKLKKLIKAMSFFENFVARGRFEAFAFLSQSLARSEILEESPSKVACASDTLWVSTRFLIERLKLLLSSLIEF